MKKILILIGIIALSLPAFTQLDITKRTVTTDSLRSRGDTLYFTNKLGSVVYFRTSDDSLFFADVNGEIYIGEVNYEPALGNPSTDGQVLSSTTAGVRSWVSNSGGSIDSIYSIPQSGWLKLGVDSIKKDTVYNTLEAVKQKFYSGSGNDSIVVEGNKLSMYKGSNLTQFYQDDSYGSYALKMKTYYSPGI